MWPSFEHLKETLARRGVEVGAFAAAYFTFRTRRLIEISNIGSTRSRLELFVVFVGVAYAVGIAGAFALGGGESPSVLSILHDMILRLLSSALILSPFVVAYRFLKPERRALPLSLLAFQQGPATIVMLVAAACLVVPQPARQDLTNLEKGEGQGTPAYDFVCGSMESLAHMNKLGRGIGASDRAISSARASLAAGNISSDQYASIVSSSFNRTVFLLHQMDGDLNDQDRYIKNFSAAYPNVAWSVSVNWIGLVIVGAFTLSHLWIGALRGSKKRGETIKIAVSLCFATGIGLCIPAAFNYFLAYPSPPEFHVLNAEGNPPRTFSELEDGAHRFVAAQGRREGRVRALFETNRVRCPGANNFGLW